MVAEEQPWGTLYRLRAYPIDARQQFRFITDLTVRGKAELIRLGIAFAMVPTFETTATGADTGSQEL